MKKLIKKGNIVFWLLICCLFLTQISVFADEISQIKSDVSQMVSQKNMLNDVGRTIMEVILKGGWYLGNGVEEAFSNIVTKYNFTNIIYSIDGMDNIFGFITITFFIGMVIVGLTIMIKGHEEENIIAMALKGVMITILILSIGGFGARSLQNAQTEVGATLFGGSKSSSLFKTMYQSNIYDMEQSLNDNKRVNLTKSNQHPLVDYGETISSDSKNGNYKFYLKYDKANKEIVMQKALDKGTWFWESDEVNYKYKCDYGVLLPLIILVIILFIVNAYKIGKNGIEFAQNIPIIFASSTLAFMNNKRKQIALLHSVSLVLVSIYIIVMLYLFPHIYAAINSVEISGNGIVQGFTRLIAAACLIFAVLDGSELIPKLAGLDAGYKNGFAPAFISFKLASGAASLLGKGLGVLGGKGDKNSDKSDKEDKKEEDPQRNDGENENGNPDLSIDDEVNNTNDDVDENSDEDKNSSLSINDDMNQEEQENSDSESSADKEINNDLFNEDNSNDSLDKMFKEQSNKSYETNSTPSYSDSSSSNAQSKVGSIDKENNLVDQTNARFDSSLDRFKENDDKQKNGG